jgi:purine-binding chemotaxis protein CheW
MSTNTQSEVTQAVGQFSTFFVADLFFGVDVLNVQEVLCAQQMSPVPRAPGVIEGLINLRGQIVTAIDMRRRLHLDPRAEGDRSMNIVVRTADGAVSLVVDEIGDVLEVDSAAYERPPDNLDPAARELIRGVYSLKDRLLLVLDTEQAVELKNYQDPRSGKLDVPASDGTASRRRNLSQASDSLAMQSESAPLQGSAKRGNRKASAKNSNGAAGAQAGPG